MAQQQLQQQQLQQLQQQQLLLQQQQQQAQQQQQQQQQAMLPQGQQPTGQGIQPPQATGGVQHPTLTQTNVHPVQSGVRPIPGGVLNKSVGMTARPNFQPIPPPQHNQAGLQPPAEGPNANPNVGPNLRPVPQPSPGMGGMPSTGSSSDVIVEIMQKYFLFLFLLFKVKKCN